MKSPEDSSNAQVPGAELEKTSGYVKNKINGSKKGGPGTRARAKRHSIIPDRAKLVEILGPHKIAAMEVWIAGLEATKEVYEPSSHSYVTVPDWKERRECANMIMAYLEGRPIERQVQARGDYADLQKMLAERIAHSKAAQDSLHNTVLGKEIIQELPDATKGDGHSLRSGQNVTNQEGPIQGSSGENELVQAPKSKESIRFFSRNKFGRPRPTSRHVHARDIARTERRKTKRRVARAGPTQAHDWPNF
jgi:hypothetical protein